MTFSRQRSSSITQAEVDAFMGKVAIEDDDEDDEGPMARLKKDISMLLKVGRTVEPRVHKHPYRWKLYKASIASTITEDALPFIDDDSNANSNSDSESDVCDSEGEARLSQVESDRARHFPVDKLFNVIFNLMRAYDFETCLASVHEEDRERVLIVHAGGYQKLWRTQMLLPSRDFSKLLVPRSIPTIVDDMENDPRFGDDFNPTRAPRPYAQVPIAFDCQGAYLGVIHILGGKGFTHASLTELLMQKADQLASIIMTENEE